MKFERKHALVLLAVAVWNVLTYSRFIKALIDSDNEKTGYYVAHSILIAVNFVIAVVLGRWGWQALKASRSTD